MNAKLLHILFLLLGILSIGNSYANFGNSASQIEISRSRIDSKNNSVQIGELWESEEVYIDTLALFPNQELPNKENNFHSNYSIDRLTYYFSSLLFDFS